MQDPGDLSDLYNVVGGEEPFVALVEAFYTHVEADSALRQLYPADLTPGKNHLTWFLIQRFGGPELFNTRRGAPRLRMRHMQFPITRDLAQHWLNAMWAAIEDVPEFAHHKAVLDRYFEDAAIFLVNRDDPSPHPSARVQRVTD